MLTEQTIDKLNAMKLHGMADAFNEQLHSSHFAELSFEERLGLLVDTEHTARENRRLSRRLRAAKLRYPASLENIDFKTPPTTQPPADHDALNLRLAHRAAQPHRLRTHRHRQILHRLRARRTGLSSWFQPPSTSALPDSSTSSLSLASMALIPQSSLGSPSSICSPSTTGSSPRSRTPNDNI